LGNTRELGAPTRAELDLFDPAAVAAAVHDADAVLHLATRIRPLGLVQEPEEWRDNDRLRGEASAILVDATLAARVAVYVQPTVTFVYPSDRAVSEETPLGAVPAILRSALAARWAEERGLGADDEPDYPREREYLVLARVLLAQGRPGPALALLERLHAAAAAQGRAGSIIEIGALRALVFAAAGDENAAVDVLAGALTLACPQGYVRVFADEGPPMAALLGRLVAAQKANQAAARAVPLGCMARVLRAFGGKDDVQGAGRGAAAAVPGLVEQLTARELEILALLAAGTPNSRIAEELVVTLDTVKKHVTHVLGKLGAANRTEAVARARELGLIP
jgi:DNA-binding NarL/FixJ family response regulator